MSYYSDFNKGFFKKNFILNGNFNVWQRGFSFTGTGNVRTADGWVMGGVMAGGAIFEISAQSSVKPNSNCTYTAKMLIKTSQPSVASGDYLCFNTAIEGYNSQRLYQNNVTLSFWAYSNVTGTYCVFFRDTSTTYTYVKDFTINNANTWEYKVINCDLRTQLGTWGKDTSRGLTAAITLICGSTYQTSTPGQWVSGNNAATTNISNTFQNTVDNVFLLSQVQLELGNVASEYEHISVEEELNCCYRYYQTHTLNHTPATSTATGPGYYYAEMFIYQMRAAPSITVLNSYLWSPGVGWSPTTSTTSTTCSKDYLRLIFIDANLSSYVSGRCGMLIADVLLSSPLL